MAKFCTNCGQPLEENACFCGHCGKKIDFQTSLATEASADSDNDSASPPAKKSGKKGLISIVLVSVVFISVVLIMSINNKKVDSPQYEYDAEGNIIKQTVYDEDSGNLSCYYVYTYDSSGNIEGYTKYLADDSVDFFTTYTYDQKYTDRNFTWNCSLYVEKFDADGTLDVVHGWGQDGEYDGWYSPSDYAYYHASELKSVEPPLEGFLENE